MLAVMVSSSSSHIQSMVLWFVLLLQFDTGQTESRSLLTAKLMRQYPPKAGLNWPVHFRLTRVLNYVNLPFNLVRIVRNHWLHHPLFVPQKKHIHRDFTTCFSDFFVVSTGKSHFFELIFSTKTIRTNSLCLKELVPNEIGSMWKQKFLMQFCIS